MLPTYDNQNLNAEELALEEMFTGDEVEFFSPEALQKEKKNLKSYQVQKAEKKSVNIRLLASDIAKIKAKSEAI
ncbi:hypothetical protein IJM86_04330 [bacterium]|nr:hypothetical protein [bacterium]